MTPTTYPAQRATRSSHTPAPQAAASTSSDAPPCSHLPRVIQWRNAIQAADLPAYAKLALYTIAQYMGPDGEDAFPSLERIAREASMTKRALRMHLNLAERRGLLKRRRRGFSTYQFWPAFMEEGTPCPGEGNEILPGEEPASPQGEHEVPPTETIRPQSASKTIHDLEPEPTPETPLHDGTKASVDRDGHEDLITDPEPPTGSVTEAPASEKPESQVASPEQVVELFNAMLAGLLTSQRKVGPVREAIDAILDERPEAEKLSWWRRRFEAIKRTPWMTGSLPSGWRASLYWLVMPDREGRLGIDKLGEETDPPRRAPGLAGRDFTGASRRPGMLSLPH